MLVDLTSPNNAFPCAGKSAVSAVSILENAFQSWRGRKDDIFSGVSICSGSPEIDSRLNIIHALRALQDILTP